MINKKYLTHKSQCCTLSHTATLFTLSFSGLTCNNEISKIFICRIGFFSYIAHLISLHIPSDEIRSIPQQSQPLTFQLFLLLEDIGYLQNLDSYFVNACVFVRLYFLVILSAQKTATACSMFPVIAACTRIRRNPYILKHVDIISGKTYRYCFLYILNPPPYDLYLIDLFYGAQPFTASISL